MKKEKIFKFEWDSDEITFDDIKKSLRLYYNNFLISNSIDNKQFTITEINEESEDEKFVLELSLFNVPEYKMIDVPNFQMEINGKSTSIITCMRKLNTVSDIRFNDIELASERDAFIDSINSELHELNPMFVYQIIETPTHDGLYKYILRGVN